MDDIKYVIYAFFSLDTNITRTPNGQENKLQFIKKKNSNFYSIMLTVMSIYTCNQSR